MKLLFKQRLLSLLDSFEIFNEYGEIAYRVDSQLALSHKFLINDSNGYCVGLVKQKVLTFLPTFEFYFGDKLFGTIKREITLFHPRYSIDFNSWHIEGDVWGINYSIVQGQSGIKIATVRRKVFNLTDTYELDIINPNDAVLVLMVVLAIDAEECSRD